jgi:hypothetical protein
MKGYFARTMGFSNGLLQLGRAFSTEFMQEKQSFQLKSIGTFEA